MRESLGGTAGQRCLLGGTRGVAGLSGTSGMGRLYRRSVINLGAVDLVGRARLDLNSGNVTNALDYYRDINNFAVIPGEPRQVSARLTYPF
jgi:hypothetical protein